MSTKTRDGDNKAMKEEILGKIEHAYKLLEGKEVKLKLRREGENSPFDSEEMKAIKLVK